MGLLDKVPFPKSQRSFFERLFSPIDGHNHDGVNSRKVPLGAHVVSDGSIDTPKIADGAVTTVKLGPAAVGSAQLADGSVGDSKIIPHIIQTTSVLLDAADIKALHTTPIELVPAAVAAFVEFISATLILDAGSEVLTGTRTLTIGWNDGTVAAAAVIPATFHEAAASRVYVVNSALAIEEPAADVIAQNLAIVASDAIGGNASDDVRLQVVVAYRIVVAP